MSFQDGNKTCRYWVSTSAGVHGPFPFLVCRVERLIEFFWLDGQFNPISFYSLKDTLFVFIYLNSLNRIFPNIFSFLYCLFVQFSMLNFLKGRFRYVIGGFLIFIDNFPPVNAESLELH
jgi:hypothetical protein